MRPLLLIATCLLLIIHGAGSQEDKKDCLGKPLPFFKTLEGFYIESCFESQNGEYTFLLEKGSQKMMKTGKYLKINYRKQQNAKRKVSGKEILQAHIKAAKGIGGEVVKGSDDTIFHAIHNGKELWISVSASQGSPDPGCYSVVSIETAGKK